MGSFWTNVMLRTDDRAAVEAAIRSRSLAPAYVTSAPGWVGVYPDVTESQDPDALEGAVTGLTAAIGSGGLATLMHDSDVFLYILADKGQVVDRFDSAPGALEGDIRPPEGGDAQKLIDVLGLSATKDAVSAAISGKMAAADPRAAGHQQAEAEVARILGQPDQMRERFREQLAAAGMPEAAMNEMLKTVMEQFSTTAAALQDVGTNIFADDIPMALEGVLGLQSGQLMVGYNYIQRGEAPTGGATLIPR